MGKIEDIFARRGLTRSSHTGNNMAGVDAIIEFLASDSIGLIIANLVDFDALYGHRNNPRGYADALEVFDRRLPEILSSLRLEDVLMIAADHGNDPTTSGTDHSRARVAVGAHVKINVYLGTRETFADVAASVAEFLEIPWTGVGRSFAKVIYQPISTS